MQKKVVWREGLFIRPQHFQQNDRYYNYELRTRTINARSNNWGLFNIDIDEHLLSIGKIIVKKISGILPDGTLFDINTEEQSDLTLEIKTTDSNKFIYLALPLFIQDSDDIHFEDQKNLLTRYRASSIPNVPNTNAGESSNSDILVANYNFKLSFEDDLNDGYIKLAIAKIASVSSSGSAFLDENYSPTFLHLNSSKKLLSKINEIVSMLNYRAEKLAEKISDSTLQATELGNYLMLQILNKSGSRFHFLLTQDKIHPDVLFLELTTLIGELAVFMKKEKRLTKQFLYNHHDQSLSFDELIDELKTMLTMVLEQHSISIPVEKRKYGIYVAPVKDKNIFKDSSFILGISADISEQKIKDILIANLKIGTIETIKNLVNYHLVGFKIKPLSAPPKEIPYRVNHLYFSLELDSENIKELIKSAGFAFHLSTDIPNINYSLWAIKK